jgi:hypothetical protein
MTACSLDETPAVGLDLKSWPRRTSLHKPIGYCEWFDWSEIFVDGIEEKLGSVADYFSSPSIRLARLLSDSSEEAPQTVRVIEIETANIGEAYFKAIWDEESVLPSGPLAAAARTTLIWDKSGKWIVLNDRYYEIGIFAVFAPTDIKLPKCIFGCLDEQTLLERFSTILAMNRIAALSEVRQWQNLEQARSE